MRWGGGGSLPPPSYADAILSDVAHAGTRRRLRLGTKWPCSVRRIMPRLRQHAGLAKGAKSARSAIRGVGASQHKIVCCTIWRRPESSSVLAKRAAPARIVQCGAPSLSFGASKRHRASVTKFEPYFQARASLDRLRELGLTSWVG